VEEPRLAFGRKVSREAPASQDFASTAPTAIECASHSAVSGGVPARQRNGVKRLLHNPRGPGRGCAAKIVAHKINKFKLNFDFLRNWKLQIVYHDNVKSAQFLLHKKAFYGLLQRGSKFQRLAKNALSSRYRLNEWE
jgi:hypothetical protein